MSQAELLSEQNETFEKVDSEPPIPPTDVVAYNELRSCADLFRLYGSGKLEIQPDFQREVVWKQDDQSRFIDSLVKQLPIPSMCFSLDFKTQRWKVIDGLQRMSSIIRFLSQPSWKLSDLTDIHPRLRGATNTELRKGTEEQRMLYGMVENVSIPITVIRCDYSQQNHMLYLFTIFHRLNSGGVRLTNQEIRNCIYTGPFNDQLKDFDKHNADWKIVKKQIWGAMDRYRSIEVLLRVLAFGDDRATYDGNLARFLNEYMHRRSNQSGDAGTMVGDLLVNVMRAAKNAVSAPRPGKRPLVQMEALLVALYVHRNEISEWTVEETKESFNRMLAMPSFTDSARYAVSGVDNVRRRLNAAIEAFSSNAHGD